MVAPRNTKKIYCTIVRVPTMPERVADRLARPSDLLPWADPYIARLVENLQQEVRSERMTSATSLQAELEPPSPVGQIQTPIGAKNLRFNLGENVGR